MSGSHMAPPRAPQQRSSSRSTSYSAYPPPSSSSSSAWKVWVLVIVLIIAIAALGFLLWQLFGGTVMDSLGLGGGGGSNATADIAPGIFTQIGAESSSGKNVAGNLAVTQGTQRPESIPPEDENVVLLDIAWTGKNAPAEPVYVTVSDPSFTDGDGLAVHHFNGTTNAWDLIGTYTIQNNSVTFLADSFSPFAFQVISANPEPTPEPTPEVTPEPTATPEPTPEPTPAPIAAVDYGSYPTAQNGVYTMVNELEDDAVYVLAVVKDLPNDALTSDADAAEVEDADSADEQTDEDLPEDETDGELSFSYVDAEDPSQVAVAPVDGTVDTAAAPVGSAPVATVLINLDGTNMSSIDMPLIQAEDGSWCLGGPITEGMLWTANRDAYKDEHRFSFANHDRYLNLDDSNANMILDDNRTRTRFLYETAKMANGSEISTLTYRNDSRYYVTDMGLAAEVVTDAAFPAGTVDENTQVSQPTYLGGAVPAADQSLYRDVMRFTLSDDQSMSKQLVAFKLNEGLTVPAGVVTTLTNQVTVPAINQDTNLETMVIMDGSYPLVLGVDYTISARVYNNSTVVVSIDFIGNYTGRIVRTYPGTLIRTNATPETTPTPEPSPTPATTGEGAGYYPPSEGGGDNGGGGNGGGGGNEATTTDTQVTVPPYDNTDGSDS